MSQNILLARMPPAFLHSSWSRPAGPTAKTVPTMMSSGAMISEGIIALIWAAAGCSIYTGAELLGMGAGGPTAVYDICQKTMGSAEPEMAPQATVMNMKLQMGVPEGCMLYR